LTPIKPKKRVPGTSDGESVATPGKTLRGKARSNPRKVARGKSVVPAAAATTATATDAWREAELLERARMQWQFGDWESLVEIDGAAVEMHAERAKLALLVASAHLQRGDQASARRLLGLARNWGCDRKLIARILVAGVHNTLGRAASLAHQGPRALSHFRGAVEGVAGDPRLACQARSVREVARLGLHRYAGELIERELADLVPAIPDTGRALPSPATAIDGRIALRMRALAAECMGADDIHAAVDAEMDSLERGEAFAFCVALSDEFAGRKDKMTAVHFLNTARQYMAQDNPAAGSLLSRKLLALGQNAPALDLLVSQAVKGPDWDPAEKSALDKAYASVRAASIGKVDHGHALLLDYLKTHAEAIKKRAGRKPLLVEVGSTRENVPGQGSTRLIAEHCKVANIEFVTVDMDPHNTASAAALFRQLGTDFRAVNAKGEDFLREFDGEIEFAFLDAYDFDHGNHSELRQSRYEKFLGSRIDELACHQMHLECAQALRSKLSATGVICVDDTWLDDGKWRAKGTLAVPYLLEHGFEIVEARNRAALLRRKQTAGP
jgi:hypothetical protein